MPMIDVYAVAGTFPNKRKFAQDLASAVMKWEKVPPISLFKNNTAAFVHELPAEAISNAAGDGKSYVRVQVLTPVGVLDRDKQLGVVRELISSPRLRVIRNSPTAHGCSSRNHLREGGELLATRTRVRTS